MRAAAHFRAAAVTAATATLRLRRSQWRRQNPSGSQLLGFETLTERDHGSRNTLTRARANAGDQLSVISNCGREPSRAARPLAKLGKALTALRRHAPRLGCEIASTDRFQRKQERQQASGFRRQLPQRFCRAGGAPPTCAVGFGALDIHTARSPRKSSAASIAERQRRRSRSISGGITSRHEMPTDFDLPHLTPSRWRPGKSRRSIPPAPR